MRCLLHASVVIVARSGVAVVVICPGDKLFVCASSCWQMIFVASRTSTLTWMWSPSTFRCVDIAPTLPPPIRAMRCNAMLCGVIVFRPRSRRSIPLSHSLSCVNRRPMRSTDGIFRPTRASAPSRSTRYGHTVWCLYSCATAAHSHRQRTADRRGKVCGGKGAPR